MSREGDMEIRFGEQVYRGNYLDDLKVDESHINDILEKQPSRYIFWSKMAAMTRVLWDKAKQDLEKYEAQMYTFVRADMANRGERPTEAQISAKIRLDPRRQEHLAEVLRTKLQYDHLATVKEAFSMRTHMLMSISANLREEWESSLSVRSKGGVPTEFLRKQSERILLKQESKSFKVSDEESLSLDVLETHPEKNADLPNPSPAIKARTDSRAERMRREASK